MLFDGNQFDFGLPFIEDAMNTKFFDYSMGNDSKLVSTKEGFLRGNMFADEYEPYKNLTYFSLKPKNEQEKLLFHIMELSFAVNDLNLYLDLHPEDTKMFEKFKMYTKQCMELEEQYAKQYGPLVLSQTDSQEYEWFKNPWPWENNGGDMYV